MPTENRILLRREIDRDHARYSSCPKFLEHEMTERQILEIAMKAVKIMRDEDNIELAKFIKKEGQGLAVKILIGLGLVGLWLSGWLQNQGMKLF